MRIFKINQLGGVLIIGLVLMFVFGIHLTAFAQNPALQLDNPLKANSIPELIGTIFKNLAYYVAPPLAALFIVWGAVLMLTSGGDPQKYEQGIKTIKYTVAGLVVVLLGTLIAQLVAELLGAPPAVIDTFKGL